MHIRHIDGGISFFIILQISLYETGLVDGDSGESAESAESACSITYLRLF